MISLERKITTRYDWSWSWYTWNSDQCLIGTTAKRKGSQVSREVDRIDKNDQKRYSHASKIQCKVRQGCRPREDALEIHLNYKYSKNFWLKLIWVGLARAPDCFCSIRKTARGYCLHILANFDLCPVCCRFNFFPKTLNTCLPLWLVSFLIPVITNSTRIRSLYSVRNRWKSIIGKLIDQSKPIDVD